MRGLVRSLVLSLARCGVVAALAVAGTGVAMAKPSTKERVTALEAEFSELEAKTGAALASAERLDELENQIRLLTGNIETLTYQLQQADAKINSLSAALAGDTLLVDDMDPFAPAGAADTSAARQATDGPTPLGMDDNDDPIASQISRSSGGYPAGLVDDIELPLDPEAAYAYANGFALQGDMGRAEAALTLYLSAFGNSARAPDVQFRLGEVYLAQQKYAEAAETFLAYVKKYPSNERAAEAYLKLGAAFSGLGQQEEACTVLRAVKSRYPGAGPQVLSRADRELQRNSCP